MSPLIATSIAGGLQAGLGLFQMKKDAANRKKLEKLAKVNIGKDILSYAKGYGKGLPKILKLEKKFRPKFQELNLNEANSFLTREGGYFDMQKLANEKQAGLLQSSRAADLQGMIGQTGATRSLLQQISPEGAAQVQAATEQAARARESSFGLSGQEQRSAEQFAREGSAARGRLNDNSSIASELMSRDSVLYGKRQEASMMTQNAAEMAQRYYSDPGLRQLGQTPESYSAGQSAVGIGLNSIGSNTPQMINPDTGVNIGAANRQNAVNRLTAGAQAGANTNSGLMQAGQSLFDMYLRLKGK